MSAQFAVLGLLMEQPLHGYAIERLIEERGMRKWTQIGFSSIYQVLDDLVAGGLARVSIEPAPGRGKERRVHHITAEGRRHWEAGASAALSSPGEGTEGFLLALSGLPFLDGDTVAAALEQRVDRLDSQLVDLERDLAAVRPIPSHVVAMFDFIAARVRCERAWTSGFLTDLTATKETRP